MRHHAIAEAIKASKSLASLRQRPSQGEGALYDPTPRKDLEARGAVGPLDHLHSPFTLFFQPSLKFRPGITVFDEEMPQPVADGTDRLNEVRGPRRDAGGHGMDLNAEHQAERVGNDITLSHLDLFASVEATRAAAVGRLHTPAVATPAAGEAALKNCAASRRAQG